MNTKISNIIEVTITKEDCYKKNGEIRSYVDNFNCPLATALKRIGYPNPNVGPDDVQINLKNDIWYSMNKSFDYLDMLALVNGFVEEEKRILTLQANRYDDN